MKLPGHELGNEVALDAFSPVEIIATSALAYSLLILMRTIAHGSGIGTLKGFMDGGQSSALRSSEAALAVIEQQYALQSGQS